MIRKTFLLCIAALFITTSVFCQSEKYLYYLDNEYRSTPNSKAIITASGSIDSGLVKVKFYITATNNLFQVSYFLDSSLSINHGLTQTFYADGRKESEGNYLYNKQVGIWKKWDKLGRVIDSSIYVEGKKVMEVTVGYSDKGFRDSYIVEDVRNDTLNKIYYDQNGAITTEARFKGQSGIIMRHTDKGVSLDTVFSREEIEASFPGGDAAWNKFVFNIFQRSADELIKDGKSGTCRVRFIIDKDGKISEVEALTMKDTRLAQIVVRAIQRGPKWNPAIQYGRHVKAFREQPVTFTVTD